MEKKNTTIKHKKDVHDNFFETMMKATNRAHAFFKLYLKPEDRDTLNLDTLVLLEPFKEEANCPYGAVTYQCAINDSQDMAYIHVVHGNPMKDPHIMDYMEEHMVLLMEDYTRRGNNKPPRVINLVFNTEK